MSIYYKYGADGYKLVVLDYVDGDPHGDDVAGVPVVLTYNGKV